jgi:very-short-patch-repair endonuclease
MSSKKERVPIKTFATGMRLYPTKAEMKLHHALMEAFRPYMATVCPQEPIGPYIADFYIGPCNFVIEVDGASHFTPEGRAHDQARNTYMRGKGLTVMRFKNRQVHRNPNACAKYVLERALPLPLKARGPKITHCPPSWTFKNSRVKRLIFWRG